MLLGSSADREQDMDTRSDAHDANQPAKDDSPLTQLVGWVLHQIGLKSDAHSAFTDSLLRAFQPSLIVHHPKMGEWFATLDAIDPADNQVSALVRLTRQQPVQPREVRTGMVAFEERGRKLFADPTSPSRLGDADLLLSYSFTPLFSLDDNLKLFREFATNEIGRLRGSPEETLKT